MNISSFERQKNVLIPDVNPQMWLGRFFCSFFVLFIVLVSSGFSKQAVSTSKFISLRPEESIKNMLPLSKSLVNPRFSKATNRKLFPAAFRYLGTSKKTFQLVLIRHGESTWNQENKFTGWYDCPLSVKGSKEAEDAGKLLKENNFCFDIAYTSMLQRAIRTLWYTLEQTGCMYIPVTCAWQLNERWNYVAFLLFLSSLCDIHCELFIRHYGALQGLDKKETVAKFGSDQVNIWRRSYDIPPPACDKESSHHPSNDIRYAGNPEAQAISTESLSVNKKYKNCERL